MRIEKLSKPIFYSHMPIVIQQRKSLITDQILSITQQK
jgi:hypothetical protein